jgi:hypothetical protein
MVTGTERRLVGILRERRAFSSSTAVPLEAERFPAKRRLERLVAARVIHEAQPGRYWLDESRWQARDGQRRARIIAVVGLVLAVAVLLLLFFNR